MPYNTKVISLLSGPGCGKSTLMASIFAALKGLHKDVEMVDEVAKHLTWSKRRLELECQVYVLGKQTKMIDVLQGQVEYIVTDSPTILSAIYSPSDYPPSFIQCVVDLYKRYKTLNFFVPREKPYNPNGRNQTLAEAKEIDDRILRFLVAHEIPFVTLPTGMDRTKAVLDIILHS